MWQKLNGSVVPRRDSIKCCWIGLGDSWEEMIGLVILLLLACEAQSTALTESDRPGFCLSKWTSKVTVSEPYNYTVQKTFHCGWRGRGVCYHTVEQLGFRIAYKDVPHVRVECCSGYSKHIVHNSTFDCVPECVDPCLNGHCIAPGNCSCSYGFEHETSNKCVPSCNPRCTNGFCEQPQTCTCLPGFKKVDNSTCAPHCSAPCINGICISPDVCSCRTGFVHHPTNSSLCEPYCEKGCYNSKCVNFNECECLDGFQKDSNVPNICHPYCSMGCINGHCTAPEICTCKDEYHLENASLNNCIPDCNCTNGYCLSPHECICFDNYTTNENGECEPICDLCINGTCNSPYNCECFEGFVKYNETTCVPLCNNCTNGICIEPEICSCIEGYQNQDDSCVPVCENGCINGQCVSPNNCACASGNEKILENVCFPLCGSNFNYSTTYCLTTYQADVKISSPLVGDSFLNLSVPVQCSKLRSLNNNSYEDRENNPSGISVGCVPIIGSAEPFSFLCLWTDKNETAGNNFDEFSDAVFIGNMSINEKETKKATVLLPNFFESEDEYCRMCSWFAEKSADDENVIIFKLRPCPQSITTTSKYQHDDASWVYIVFGFVIIGVVIISATFFIIFKKQQFHEYVVSKEDNSRLYEINGEEQEMLPQGT